MNMIATVCQWTPQIVQTLITKNVGQLSIALLAIQGPGNALYAFFLGFSQKLSLTTYLPFAISSAQQCFLLIVCVVLACRARIERRRQELLREPDKAPGALVHVAADDGPEGGAGAYEKLPDDGDGEGEVTVTASSAFISVRARHLSLGPGLGPTERTPLGGGGASGRYATVGAPARPRPIATYSGMYQDELVVSTSY